MQEVLALYFSIVLITLFTPFSSLASSGHNASPNAIETAMPAVVSIYVYQAPSMHNHNARPHGGGRSLGSVFFVSENGMIVTNAHVIHNATTIRVVLTDGRERRAKVIGRDETTDIAVIQANLDKVPYLELAPKQPHIGDHVYAIGNAFGQPNSVTSGIISALHRAPMSSRIEDFIQTDTAINMGNSGGPLINQKGELIGVNTLIIGVAGGNNGVGFAIPTYLVKNIANQIIQHGTAKPSLLGVNIQDLSTELAKIFQAPQTGSLITRVFPESAASRAGLKPQDVIIGIDKETVQSSSQLKALLYSRREGSSFNIKVRREGKTLDLPITTQADTAIKAPSITPSKDDAHPLAGVAMVKHEHLETDGDLIIGLRVLEVHENSASWIAGLLQGDIITHVNGKEVGDLSTLMQTPVAKNSQYLLRINRMGSPFYLALRSKAP